MEIFFISLEIFAAITAGVCVCCLVFVTCRGVAKWNLSRNIYSEGTEASKINNSWLALLLRNGVTILQKPAEFINEKSPSCLSCIRYIKIRLNRKGITSTDSAICSSILGLVILIAIVVSLVFWSPVAGVAVAVFVVLCLYVSIKAAIEKETEVLRAAVPDALNTMLSCFQSGYSLSQTFAHLQTEGEPETKKLFESASQIFATGGTVDEALDSLKTTKTVPELAFVALALDVQHQTGGSIRPVLESAKEMVESKLELMAHLKVQTAQAKLSARVVTLLPFGLIAVFSVISPDFLKPFFSSFLGFLVFCVVCVMQASGIILVRKMLKVEI